MSKWIVAGTMTVEADKRAAFIESRRDKFARTAQEKGCLEVGISADPFDDQCVRLYELWASGEDLDAHMVRDRSAETHTTDGLIARDYLRYEVGEARPL